MKYLSVLQLALSLCLFASDALAYIDAGTGSFIIQILIATLVVVAVFFRSFWARIKNLFGMRNRNTSSHTEAVSIKETNTHQNTGDDKGLGDNFSSQDTESSRT